MLPFIAETREYAGGCLHNGDKPSGESIARHLGSVTETLPKTVEILRARADAGFYCWEAVKTYSDWNCEFVIVARKTERFLGELQGELQAADWQPSPRTDADFECQFSYWPEGWDREYRFVGLRCGEPEPDADNPDQIGLFDGMACRYRVFVTSISRKKWSPAEVVEFCNKRAAVENLIKESNNEIGLTAHPSEQWAMNANPLQLSMIAYNLNCWLELFEREESVTEIHFGSQYQEPLSQEEMLDPIEKAKVAAAGQTLYREEDTELPARPAPAIPSFNDRC